MFTHTSTGICPGTTLVAIKYTSTNETSGRQGTGSKTTNGNMNAWLSTPANAYNGGYGRKRGGRSDANTAKEQRDLVRQQYSHDQMKSRGCSGVQSLARTLAPTVTLGSWLRSPSYSSYSSYRSNGSSSSSSFISHSISESYRRRNSMCNACRMPGNSHCKSASARRERENRTEQNISVCVLQSADAAAAAVSDSNSHKRSLTHTHNYCNRQTENE